MNVDTERGLKFESLSSFRSTTDSKKIGGLQSTAYLTPRSRISMLPAVLLGTPLSPAVTWMMGTIPVGTSSFKQVGICIMFARPGASCSKEKFDGDQCF